MNQRDDPDGGYASPPCSLADFGADCADAPGSQSDVAAWRGKERARLIALRQAIEPARRPALDRAIVDRLHTAVPAPAGKVVSLYWPIRGEPDIRGWRDALDASGATVALPVVVTRAAPLAFREWRAGAPMARDVVNIPVPAGGELLTPDVIVSPLVGYDPARQRLGNGGGYFDRTLAALAPRPLVIGVGYARCEIRTIYPQAFDVAMDIIITERAVMPAGATRA